MANLLKHIKMLPLKERSYILNRCLYIKKISILNGHTSDEDLIAIHGNGFPNLIEYKNFNSESLQKNIKHLALFTIILTTFISLIFSNNGGLFFNDISHNFFTLKEFSKFWLTKIKKYNLDEEYCTVESPNYFADVFRPPVNCEKCRNISGIPKISNITQLQFELEYAYSLQPIVITDAQINWTAKNTFNLEFFKNVYKEGSPVLEKSEKNCQFFPYKTEFKSLVQVFNMSKERAKLEDNSKPWYVGWSNCDPEAANILRNHYSRPYFLPSESESSRTDWIFMGSPGYGAHMHIDHVGKPSWQAQIGGYKKWMLEPPPECYLVCKNLEVIINPGETIVLDTNKWYHMTLVIGNDMSIVIGSEYD
ncbi:bifunctional arginine demethylase and lysyl-hydroxylase JMJD6-like [Gordionus sp. m RMFG-2023]|uniref:bifunctional arginine demethylase and lysyl-hydroxylase JMJD6-like n=1 Tax=Gordionus sp. m RMFG-2023 TaxID=3053472 RepID=UPI0031FDEB64